MPKVTWAWAASGYWLFIWLLKEGEGAFVQKQIV